MEDRNGAHGEITALAKGAGVFFFGMMVGNGLRYVYQLIVARSMGPDVYGALLLGIAVLQVLQLVADLGLSQGVVRYTAVFQGLGDRPRVKGVILLALRAVLVSGPLIGVLLFLGSRTLAFRVFHAPDLVPILRFMAVILPLYALTMILAFSFQGLQIIRYRVYVSQFVEPGVRVLAAAAFLAAGAGLSGLLSAYVTGMLLALAAAAWLMKIACPELFRPEVSPVIERKKLFSFSWPLLFSFLLVSLVLWNDTFFLGILRSSREVGVFGAAQRTALLLTFVLSAFTVMIGPLVADFLNRDRKEDLSRHFKTAVHWSFSLTLPCAALLVLFARPVLRLFGDPFTAAAGPLVILAFGWTVNALLGLCGTVITMSGRSKLQLGNAVFLVTVNVFLHLLLIPRYGIHGAAAATAGSIIFYNTLTLFEVRLLLGLSPFRTDLLKPVAAAGLAAACCLAAAGLLRTGSGGLLFLASGSALFLLIYGAAMLGLGIRDEDRVVLRKILLKLKSLSQGDTTCASGPKF